MKNPPTPSVRQVSLRQQIRIMWVQPRNGTGWRAADSVQSLKEEPTVIERERMTSAGAESVAAARLEITPCASNRHPHPKLVRRSCILVGLSDSSCS